MIELYQFPKLPDLPNFSPFCMKIETYLRMVQLPFEIIPVNDPRQSPKGKLPYIKDDNRIIGDSNFIIDYLKEKYGDALDDDLTSSQKAVALSFKRLMEEHFYFILVYSRWMDENNWPKIKKLFFGNLNRITQSFVANKIRKYMKQQLIMQGICRHSQKEVYQLGCADITAIATALGEQKYFLGAIPTSIDACLYAFLANVLYAPITSPLKEHTESFANLISYCNRMKERFYK